MEKENDIIIYRTFCYVYKAYIMQGVLRTNGIPCFLSDENINNLYPLYNVAVSGIKLHTFRRDIEQADVVLQAQQEDFVQEVIYCPHCQSIDVEELSKFSNKKSVLLSLLFSLLCSVSLIFPIEQSFCCHACGTKFKQIRK